ncbi:hypothetical protein SAMN06295912_108113 [Sphingomonas laterariae]|uniref:Uncharacterized protein n=1 Tax=Edaphosphingomonas laterariae TaxID=861865 RepID=A0A239FAH9_9SPHN|nr:hypothetical protein [Sphingomonas laterariae]SNS53084.1 hypothetical protein SAMN06295912_108113 [Sphingomonas laterariae]
MTQFTAQMDAALAGAVVTVFGAIQIDLPGYSLKLLDGSGALKGAPWNSFVGRDPTYGALAAIDDLRDGSSEQAPRLSITLNPASDAAAASLAAPSMQGSPVSLWIGAVDEATGAPIPDPELVFLGELDVPHLMADENGRTLEYEVGSVFDRLFELDEGARLTDSFHQSIWPGETGLSAVTGVIDQIYWGMQAPVPAVTQYFGGFGGLADWARNQFV